MKKANVFLLIVWVGILALLAGCAAAPTPLPTPVPLPTRPPATAAVMTPTPIPPPTLAPSATPLPPATPAAAPGPDLSQSKILFGGFLPEYNYFVAVELPEAAQGPFYAIVDENKEYSCVFDNKQPRLLYCSGPLVRIYDWASFDLYADGADTPVFEGKFFVPMLDT